MDESGLCDFATLGSTQFHTKSASETASFLRTDAAHGLPSELVPARLERFGQNLLRGGESVRWYKVLWAQVVAPMTVILIIGLIIACSGQDFVEAGVLALVILTNTGIGFQQEYRAELTMDSLRKMASPTARVLRDTTVDYIAATDTVPGDILLFEEGDIIPADARLIETFHLEVDEAMLTGESLPVQKGVAVIPSPETPVGDRVNLVYSSTLVTKGRGKAIAIRTGMQTEIGRIAIELEKAGKKFAGKLGTGTQETQLEKMLAYLSYVLLVVVALLAVIVFAANGFAFSSEVASYALSVVVAVLPEGLTAVITITMALGVRKMASQKAIVRKKMALEALGAVTNICSDKTGTLTQGKMVLKRFYVPCAGHYSVDGLGYKPSGKVEKILEGDESDETLGIKASNVPASILRLTQCAGLCNMAIIKRKGVTAEAEGQFVLNHSSTLTSQPKHASPKKDLSNLHQISDTEMEQTNAFEWEAIGDPTEAALQAFAWKLKLGKPHLDSESTHSAPMSFQLLQEYGFDSTLKRMSVIYRETTVTDSSVKLWVFAKGSVESIIGLCKGVVSADGNVSTLDEAQLRDLKADIFAQTEKLAALGLRVLALAYKNLDFVEKPADMAREEVEQNLGLLGIVGIYDPPRVESSAAVLECRLAGISVHMLTGDHLQTAVAIAKEIGIIPEGQNETVIGRGFYAMRAVDFDNIPDSEIDLMDRLPSVIARCSPTTKVKMVEALQRRKKVVAMTGDGTNDAPSLKKAQVGIAMGMNGSDVAKQASDIVLTDDNFATIVRAVSEGRRIFINIQKFILHLMAGNVAEIIALIIGLAFKGTDGKAVYLMSPVQVLFLNMLTSSPPAMGLGLERATPDLMKQFPRDESRGLFSVEAIVDIFVFGTMMGCLTLMNWSIVLYTSISGVLLPSGTNPLYEKCNSTPTHGDFMEGCRLVYRARATSFLTLTFLLMIHAYNCRSMRYSILTGEKFATLKAYMSNKFLLVSVVSGLVITVATVYIPKVNTLAFKQLPIDREWGVILGACLFFLAFAELFKYLKRHYWKIDAPLDAFGDAAMGSSQMELEVLMVR